MLKRLSLMLCTFAALAALMTSQAFAADFKTPEDLHFTVVREGDDIGTHVMKFSQDGDATNIDIVTDVAVKLAFITVYRFEHKGTETWKNGNFVATSTVSNDDGTNHVLKVEAKGDSLVVNGNGDVHETPVGIMPASLWHPDIVKHNVLLNTLHGGHMKVKVEDLGSEWINSQGKSVPAQHYVITGELERELWFEKNTGKLVQVRFKGEDGSEILYVLK